MADLGAVGRAWLDSDFVGDDDLPTAKAWSIMNARTAKPGPCSDLEDSWHAGCLFIDRPAPGYG